MALDWPDGAKALLTSAQARIAILLRVETDPIIRVWSGIGDFSIPADAVETAGAVFEGVGDVVGIPAVQQLINGVAERVEFAISNVSTEVLNSAAREALTVNGAQVLLGFCVLDGSLQLGSPVAWPWEGEADVVTTNRVADADGTVVRSVSLSVGSIFTGRRRPPLSLWTDPQQKLRSPDDDFSKNVAGYTAGTTVRFKPRDDS